MPAGNIETDLSPAEQRIFIILQGWKAPGQQGRIDVKMWTYYA
jgi:hypothetical protein